METKFQLLVWFRNQDSNGKEKSYPLLLTCPLQVPWSPRELVCEQNYMEVEHKFCFMKCTFPDINSCVETIPMMLTPYPQVSVLKLLPPDNHIGTAWVTPAPVVRDCVHFYRWTVLLLMFLNFPFSVIASSICELNVHNLLTLIDQILGQILSQTCAINSTWLAVARRELAFQV